MTMQTILANRAVENLRKESDHRLENDMGSVVFGKEKYGPNRDCPYITVMDNTDGYGTEYTFHKSAPGLWDVVKSSRNGQTESEILLDDMKDGVDSLTKLGLNCGPLMKRAICAIAIQHDCAVRIGESLMDTAMRRANLSVSKDGKISDKKTNAQQNVR